MRLLALLSATVAVATCLATFASSSTAALPDSARALMRPKVQLAPTRQLALAQQTAHHARDVLGFLRAHPHAGTARSRAHVRRDYRWLLTFALAKAKAAALHLWPPHHALWLCISHREGGIRSVNPNGHFGMLQMHAGWGYGTSYHASDDSQLVQEWSAERGYRASGFSLRWLYGQWGADAGCFASYA